MRSPINQSSCVVVVASFVLTLCTTVRAAPASGETVPLPAPDPPGASALATAPPAINTPGTTIHIDATVPGNPSPTSSPTPPPPVQVDRPSTSASTAAALPEQKFLSGFRLGYSYVADFDKPTKTFNGESLAQRTGMRSPHQFLIGYEGVYRMVGQSWLNVILVGNVMAGGLEQSKFYPSVNALLGFEFNNNFQIGVGANVTPLKDNIAHTIFAAGWTPQAGSFYVPIHVFFVPDVDGVHRMGVTTGVTW